MTADPWVEGIEVPGHHDSPSLTLTATSLYEVQIERTSYNYDGLPDFYSALDLLEAALCVAWAADPEGTTEVLTRGDFESPRIGPQEAEASL